MDPLPLLSAKTEQLFLSLAAGAITTAGFMTAQRHHKDDPNIILQGLIAGNVPAIAWQVDHHLRIMHITGDDSNPLCTLLRTHIGNKIYELLHHDQQSAFHAQHERAMNGSIGSFECNLLDGHYRVMLEPFRGKDGLPIGVYGIALDLSEIQHLREQLQHERHVDDLTGLATRSRFNDRLSQALHIASHNEKKVGILIIDIDRFKLINEGNGHATGDHLLRSVGDRICAVLRKADTVARLGADNFAAILIDVDSADNAAAHANHLIHAFEQPFFLEGVQVFITVSVGIAISPFDGNEQEILLGNAETALSFAKLNGGNSFHFYTIAMHHQIADRIALETALRAALTNENEIELYYQPLVGRNGKIASVEALARWHHPTLGLLGPMRFIPLAEETGLIVPLGELIFELACRDLPHIIKELGYDIRVAINISPRQFDDDGFISAIERIIKEAGLIAELVELEITESLLMRDMNEAIEQLQRLKANGHSISIDDFGTGYSSLAYLKRLPVDTLKIDRSFVMELPDDRDAGEIIGAVCSLAHALNLDVVAEGVETPEQLQALLSLGCDRLQGFLFSRPISLEGLADILRHPQLFHTTEEVRVLEHRGNSFRGAGI